MSVIQSEHVGRVWVPELDRVTVGPATPGGRRQMRYAGIVAHRVRHADGGEERGWAPAVAQYGGLIEKWRASDVLQQIYATPEAFIRAVRGRLFVAGYAHNERVQNGARMLFKSFWGLSTSPSNATVNTPSYIAIDNASGFTTANYTWAHDGTDQSLGNGSAATGANVTTNEITSGGLARAAGTVGSYADPTALDGVATCTVTKTMTCTAGPLNTYGAGLVDAASTSAFNLFAEAPWSGGLTTLQTNDTLAVTWNISA